MKLFIAMLVISTLFYTGVVSTTVVTVNHDRAHELQTQAKTKAKSMLKNTKTELKDLFMNGLD